MLSGLQHDYSICMNLSMLRSSQFNTLLPNRHAQRAGDMLQHRAGTKFRLLDLTGNSGSAEPHPVVSEGTFQSGQLIAGGENAYRRIVQAAK